MDHRSDTPDRLRRLDPARLWWDGNQPRSVEFGDIYHAADGTAEVRRVFIAPNRLDERFSACSGIFRIGELGFGTGLNFVVAAAHFLERAPASSRLHFVSFDIHPLTHEDFIRLAARRGRELQPYHELARAYPPLVRGWHRRHLFGGRIVLSVFFGDAAEGLGDLVPRPCAPIDAWFLDGFAPDRNPAMWSETVLRAIAALSGKATTLATFSSAGRVRRGLEDAGFGVERVDQRPFKRHTLRATFAGGGRARLLPPPVVNVLGAGLAGCATARTLADWGMTVRLIDHVPPARNALRGALLHPRLLARTMDWRPRAFAYAVHRFDGIHGVERSGALQFATDGFPPERLERIAVDTRDIGLGVSAVSGASASALIGARIHESALHFRNACVIDLDAACEALAEHTGIERIAAGAEAVGPTVVCTGALPHPRVLGMRPIEGQIDVLEAAGGPALPIVGEGFAAPLARAYLAVGSTYEHRPWEAHRATAFNRDRARRFFARLGLEVRIRATLRPLRGVRAVTRDRLPAIGRIGAADDESWLNVGHGSTGTITAPLGAACVAAELAGDFAPLALAEIATFDARRFETQRRVSRRRGY